MAKPRAPAPTFAARLRDLRTRAGLSAYALAARAKVSRQYVSQLEAGTSAPSWETVQALAAALGVSTEDFRC